MIRRLLSAFIAVALIFAVASCAKASTDESYWSIVTKRASVDDYLEYYAVLNVSGASSSNKIHEIWVKAGGFLGEQAKFDIAFGSSSTDSSLRYSKKTDLQLSAKIAADADGWFRLCDDLSVTYAYASISTSDAMRFYEIVFLNEDHEVLQASVVSAGERNPSNHTTGITYDLTNVSDEPYTHLADKIADKQTDFSYDKINELYERSVIKNS